MNVVEIVVRAKDMSEQGFASAEARSKGLGETMRKAGAVAAAGFAVVGYEAVKMATKFDAQMTLLNTQAGVSKSKIGELSKGVLQLAGQVGFSPDSLAESLFHVESNFASLGIKAPQALHLVKIAAEGAAVGHADLVDVTNALTAAVASGIPGVKNMGQAMGMLNAIVGSGDMKMQDLAEAFGSGMVATVKGFGLSLKDVGAALATFGDNNIRGAHAGTQLRMSVMALAVPAKAGQDQLIKWGFSANKLATDMRQGGLIKALDDLHHMFVKAGIGAKEQGDVITSMFGKKAGAGLNVLMDQLDRLHSKYPAITRGAKDFGDAWATTQKTFSQQLKQLQGSFDALMITIGNKLIPVIQRLVVWILNNKSTVGTLLIVMGTLAGVLAAYAITVKLITVWNTAWAIGTKAVAAGQWLLNVALSANPIGLIIIAVAALIGGLILLYKHSALFRAIVKDTFHIAKVVIMDVWDWVRGHWPLLLGILTGPIGMAVYLIVRYWHDIVAGVQDAVRWIEHAWSAIETTLTRPIKAAYDQIMQWFHDIENFVGSIPGMVGHALSSIPGVGAVAHMLGLASGGVVGAASGGARSGMVMVGERGRELARLPAGTTVFNNAQTERMMGAGPAAPRPVVLQVAPGGNTAFEQFMTRAIRDWVQVQGGGDVQAAFGGTP